MSENRETYEPHGCVMCGRSHTMLVVYTPDGRFLDAAVTSPGGRRVPDPAAPLAACDHHTPAEVEAAVLRHKARAARARDGEDED